MRAFCATLLSAILGSAAFAQVPFERIVNADQTPGDWLTYSRDFSGHRFSPLAEITADNVANLKVKWAFQFPADRNEVSPLVFGGVMYVTAGNWAAALDVHAGRPFWTWQRTIPEDYHNIGFGRVNRGPAVLDDKLFVTTLDCRLVALDLKSGAERWNTKVCDYKLGYSMTVAPLAIDGKIVVGVSGGEAGIRGFLDAYDAKSGKRVWRFWTIPGPGEPGHETWAGDSWKTGGGPTWVTGAYDPELKLVYWGVGNPSPDWNGDARQGDNLYACSLLAIDAETGKLRWHFQFTPHDTHDWDAAHTPVLFNAQIDGRERKLIAEANRNAFYYVLDRVSGEFLAGQPYAKETWASGLDSKGKPITTADSVPSEKGALIWPNLNGATVWFSPSYSPQTGFFYVAARNVGSVYFKREAAYKPDTFFAGGGEDELPPDQSWGEIRALEATTGATKWIFRLHTPPWAGVLSTAGGLVFSGTNEGNFFALDARTGKSLWEFQTGGPISANPISYKEDEKQRIAICADRVLYVFGL
ncbi:MAG TPA: PQQ-dependent dehydrogenase, methanol/ethanol family [Candidatus Acidoferrum sp.]|nr:PQQ-dependent dehydrogenase, methanol/ethanol family [Candidatus Acidoferrum sp.]